jgi:hypothetical protein
MQLGNIKQVYSQQTPHIKNIKHSYVFRLLPVAIFREYQYFKMYRELSYIDGNVYRGSSNTSVFTVK